MVDKNLYINDLIARNSGYSVSESTTGSIITVTFMDGSSDTVAEATGLTTIDAYRKIRLDVLDGESPPFLGTTAGLEALEKVDEGTIALNTTTGGIQFYTSDAWVNISDTGTSTTSESTPAFGEMVEDNSSGSSIPSSSDLWSTASVGVVDSNSLVTFSGSDDAGDKLVVGEDGSGTYQIHFSCTFTNAGGNVVEAGIHLNGAEVTKLSDSHAGDSSEQRDLRGSGFLVLADNDEITLHVLDEEAGATVTVYHCHVTIIRIT